MLYRAEVIMMTTAGAAREETSFSTGAVVISSNFEASNFEVSNFEASNFEVSSFEAPFGGGSGFKACWFTGPLWLIELQVKG
jgi:hypothetical protein